jgi:hypothetical protein
MKTRKFDLLYENIMDSINTNEFSDYDELVNYIKVLYPDNYEVLLDKETIWYRTGDGKFKLDKIKADYLNTMYNENHNYDKRKTNPEDVPAEDKPYKLSPEEEYNAFKEVERTWAH